MSNFNFEISGETGNKILRDTIKTSKPFCLIKLRNHEIQAVYHYLKKLKSTNPLPYPPQIVENICMIQGVYPVSESEIDYMCSVYIENLKHADICISYEHKKVLKVFCDNETISVKESTLFPFLYKSPWTKSLHTKKVLLIHPFTTSIKKQIYKHNIHIHSLFHPNTEFHLFKIPLTASLKSPIYKTWHDGLKRIKRKLENIDFDIALVSAGAWSVPLCCFIKTLNKQAVHVGDVLQLYFGIKGHRWDNHIFSNLYNNQWVRPMGDELPKNFFLCDNGCYW